MSPRSRLVRPVVVALVALLAFAPALSLARPGAAADGRFVVPGMAFLELPVQTFVVGWEIAFTGTDKAVCKSMEIVVHVGEDYEPDPHWMIPVHDFCGNLVGSPWPAITFANDMPMGPQGEFDLVVEGRVTAKKRHGKKIPLTMEVEANTFDIMPPIRGTAGKSGQWLTVTVPDVAPVPYVVPPLEPEGAAR